jgi:hypothetical protein
VDDIDATVPFCITAARHRQLSPSSTVSTKIVTTTKVTTTIVINNNSGSDNSY